MRITDKSPPSGQTFFSQSSFGRAFVAPFTITRPNNVVAYANGQVFGPAGDARFSITAPALPSNAASPGYTSLTLSMTNLRSPADGALSLCVHAFKGLPATVLADQQAFSISDADILLLLNHANGQNFSFATGVGGTGALNQNAGANGRRAAGAAISLAPASDNILVRGAWIPPGDIIAFYFKVTAAYTPLAQEQIIVYPIFQYWVRE